MPVSGSCEPLHDDKIKAGFTYRFILFSQWPDKAFTANPSKFIIGIVGKSPFNGFFDQVLGSSVDGRELVIRNIADNPSADDLRECQVVFIHDSYVSAIKPVLQELAGAPVLTISDAPDFLEEGGMIAFLYRRNRIRFMIHKQRANLVGLRFRAQMLKMATKVVEGK